LDKLVIAGTLIQQDKAGKSFYEWKRKKDPEARIICTTCDAAIGFEKDYLHGIAQTISSDFDYELECFQMTLYGRCPQCRNAGCRN
jgi:Fe2+ or Zn2+ uptake regulation protein